MKKEIKIIYGIGAILLTAVAVYAIRRKNTLRRVAEVADEGYETAADVLHPKTNQRFKKLHYGPVLPHHDA